MGMNTFLSLANNFSVLFASHGSLAHISSYLQSLNELVEIGGDGGVLVR